jgi:asparagine synthase (glutamine-hydrolysing)
LGIGALRPTEKAPGESFPIVSDARIDNRDELRRDLAAAPGATDDELILAAYRRWDECCAEHLLGDFAFVIWDAGRQRVFCACDRFCVKPLYWHSSNCLAAAATEIKSLLALEEVPRRLNEARFADFLTLQVEDPRSTVYRDIFRLPPAHSLTLDRHGARLRRYWALDPAHSLDLGHDADYEEAFRTAFLNAVECRLPADRPVGAMLSGGMDSSSIVAAARHLTARRGNGGAPVQTLSAVFDRVDGADEREYIEAVLAMGGLEPSYVRPELFDPLGDWEGAAWRGDEPEPNPQVSITRSLYEAAANAGLDCTLEGLGGDFVVSFGAERLTELAARGRWLTLLREARAFGRRADFVTTSMLLRKFAISPFLPEPVARARRARRERIAGLPEWSNGLALTPEFSERNHLADRYAELGRGREREPRDPRRAQYNVITSALVPVALGVVDRIAAGFGVEPRYPFLDSRLVELCLAMPPDQKLRDGYNRDILRRGLDDLLPPMIRWRPGKGRPGTYIEHSLPVVARNAMDDVLLGDPGRIDQYVDIGRVREQYRQCLAGGDANAWFPVFRVVVGAMWLRHAQERFGLEV